MAKPYDATTKQLLERHPVDWLRFAGLPVPPSADLVRVVDAEVSTFTAAADKVIRVGGPFPYIAHFEFHAGRDPGLDLRVLVYNVLLRWRHGLPVVSVVIMLRPEADSPAIAGRVHEAAMPGQRLEFEYTLVKVWQQRPEVLLAGGAGIVPLAPIGDVAEAELAGVVREVEQRLEQVTAPAEARELQTASFILMGLRHAPAVVYQLLQRVRQMKESSTYQMILAEGAEQGKAEEARSLLMLLGRKRFGAPDPGVQSTIERIQDVAQLEVLVERALDVAGWDELLADIR